MDARQLLEQGLKLHTAGRLAEAEAVYQQILSQEPNHPDALHLLGALAQQVGQGKKAEELIGRAITIAPQIAEYHCTLGNTLFHVGKVQSAIASYERCIALSPNYADVCNNLGNALWVLGRIDESIAAYRKALELRPQYPDALSNLAGVLKGSGRVEEALECFEKMSAMNPNDAELHSNFIQSLNYSTATTLDRIQKEQEKWDRQFARPLAGQIRPSTNDRSPERRLRIGYVSADFRDHVVAWNLLPILEKHDHRNFEIFCYSNVINADAMTGRIQSQADQWRVITGMDEVQVADLIRQDGIDILIDLSMHSAGNRLLVFARKPAPIQMTYLGDRGGTGLSAMDYRFSDPWLDSPQNERFYAEKTLYLPHSYWCYRPGGDAPEPAAAPPAESRGSITFGSMNNFTKVSLPAQKLWAEILCGVSDSHLLLHAQPGKHLDDVKSRFAGWGVDPQRLEFIGKQPWNQYMRTYERIDIALDPFPYNGAITTCDALWMGVPVVTLVGETSPGRAGYTILSNAGLPELIAHSPGEYAQIATRLAGDNSHLKQMRGELRKKMQESPLMNAGQFTSEFETILRQAWRNWCRI